MSNPRHDCGDPACDACHPPRSRCPVCGALHAEGSVPYCSLACATADVGAPPVPPPEGGPGSRHPTPTATA